MSVWDDFNRLTHLRIDYPNSMNKTAEIYGNGRNQVEVMITLRVVDKNQLPLPLKETDLEKYVYLCDYYTGKEVSIPWSVANQDNGYNKVISYHSFSDNESKQNIADEGGFIRIHKFISCDRQDNGIVIAAGINIPEVGKFNTSMFGTATRNGAKGKEGKIFKNPQYVNVIAREPIVYSNESEFEFVLNDFRDVGNFGYQYVNGLTSFSDGKISIRTIKIKPSSINFKNNFFKEYILDKEPVDQSKMDNSGNYFKLFPEGSVSPYVVFQKQNEVVLMYFNHNHINIEGHFSLFIFPNSEPDIFKCFPKVSINNEIVEKGNEIVLYLCKLTAPSIPYNSDYPCYKYSWNDGSHDLTMKLMDSYGNSGALTLMFENDHFNEPRIILPAIE
ncbi:MAG TPA: hypothetical protein ACHBX6_11650 [Arsenophonus nasoniae]|uniref:hypothetical protein n=1 Tax=Arsenophonus nasoniae TaxID=638 RepID=UPI003878FE3D